MRRVLPIAALLLAAFPGLAGAAQARDCAVLVDPEPGWPGASLKVAGSGFEPGSDITVYLGEFPVYDGFIDAAGGFAIEVRIPIPFQTGDVGLLVVDHTDQCGVEMPYVIGEPPVPESAAQFSVWDLAFLVAVGAALGFGVAGLVLRRR